MQYPGITLVTGATGFIGKHLVKQLHDQGIKIRASGLNQQEEKFFRDLGIEFIPADLSKPKSLVPLFTDQVDRVFHLGAICNFSTPYSKLEPVNVKGVEHITGLALKAGVKRFVHVSSTSLYGPYCGVPFTEESPRDPQDDYGKSKRNGEDVVLQRMQEGLKATILRPSTVYGPGCNEGAGKVFSRPTRISAIPGNGRQKLANVRAEDVARAAVYLSLSEEAVNQIYNVSDGCSPTVEEALRLAAEVFGVPAPAFHAPLPVVKLMAWMGGLLSRLNGSVPDLEYDAVRYLGNDYVVEISKLLRTGFKFSYPDFYQSIKTLNV